MYSKKYPLPPSFFLFFISSSFLFSSFVRDTWRTNDWVLRESSSSSPTVVWEKKKMILEKMSSSFFFFFFLFFFFILLIIEYRIYYYIIWIEIKIELRGNERCKKEPEKQTHTHTPRENIYLGIETKTFLFKRNTTFLPACIPLVEWASERGGRTASRKPLR